MRPAIRLSARYDATGKMSTKAITYLGHASVIIQLAGLNLYTDPHFGKRSLLVPRKRPPPIDPGTLSRHGVILLSHSHYDHLDLHSFKYFSGDMPVVLPFGLAGLMQRFVRNPLIELTEGASWSIGPVRIRAVPAKHPGGRWTGLRYRASLGYLIECEETRIYFAGDTAYDESLLGLRDYGPIDLALLPIGPVYPKFYMKRRHLDPDDALRLLEALDAKRMVPIHWGMFRLGLEGASTPLHWLKNRLKDSPLRQRVLLLDPGDTVGLDDELFVLAPERRER